jgi:hypothetical protein
MGERPGFLSGSGVVVGVLALLGVVVWTLLQGLTPFSPGSLNAVSKTSALGGVTSHARLGADCGSCHTAPWSSATMADRCMACHSDIRAEVQGRTGLHGHLVGGSARATCRGCHTEHHGPGGALTVIDPAAFPHDLTGYSLRGHRRTAKGTAVTCRDCHPVDLAHFDQATCASCHGALNATFMSQHVAAFGRACTSCHNGADPFGAGFSHTIFPISHGSRERQATCETCHPHGFTTYTCFGCHQHTATNVVGQHEGGNINQLSDCIRCHAGGRVPD